MLDNILQFIFSNQWRVIFIVGAILLGAGELGYRRGLRLHLTKDDARKSQIGGIQGAFLGLMGLLLGFTFSMAISRYEVRRTLVLEEANAIGTAYLCASLLPEEQKQAAEPLLRRYVDARLTLHDAGADKEKQAATLRETTLLQRDLWTQAKAAGKASPTSVTATFINALSHLIDLDAKRQNTLRTHVPGAVWLLVLCVASAGCCASGYAAGASGARSTFANHLLPLVVAIVITLIADLGRPHGGLITISQAPMQDLKTALNTTLQP